MSHNYSKSLGKDMEDVPLDQLAVFIMKQLARRDRMVYDVEIYEFVKRQVSFKETNGGILIKNKKFMLDGSAVSADETLVAEPEETLVAPPQVRQMPANGQVFTPISYEVYIPDNSAQVVMAKRGAQLTPRKKYPILKEEVGDPIEGVASVDYLVVDDVGKKVKVPSMYFEPERKGLVAQSIINATEANRNHGGKLLYQQPTDGGMPVIRGSF